MRCASFTLHHFGSGDAKFFAAHAAEYGMHHAGRPVNIEAQLHQPVDHVLNLRPVAPCMTTSKVIPAQAFRRALFDA